VCGPLRQGIGEPGAEGMKHRRPRGPFGFQALVALYAAVDILDGFALFPDQGHPVDAPIAHIEQGQIVDVAIGLLCQEKPRGSLAHAEHGEKLCAPRRLCRHTHQSTEHSGHEHAPPPLFQAHICILTRPWPSSWSHLSRAE